MNVYLRYANMYKLLDIDMKQVIETFPVYAILLTAWQHKEPVLAAVLLAWFSGIFGPHTNTRRVAKNIEWNLSVTTTSKIKFITCDLLSNVF